MEITVQNGLKTLSELEREINSGKRAYARGKQGSDDIELWLMAPGKYGYLFEWAGQGRLWISGDSDTHTLADFMNSILAQPIDDGDELTHEMYTYLTLPVWTVAKDAWCVGCNELLGEGIEQCAACGEKVPKNAVSGPSYEGDNLALHFTATPESLPYQAIYHGGQWHPCLIIEGPDTNGYNLASRVVVDAPRALKLLEFLQHHKSELEAIENREFKF